MEKTITNRLGSFRGTVEDGVISFKGIRYARAERWGYPVVENIYEGVTDATSYGPCCYQPRAFADESKDPDKLFYYREFRKDVPFTYSEDCLVLNIFAPENAVNLPVIFYIHGGGFKSGSADEIEFDPPVWPRKGIVAVTINYRLGPMGFMCLPELKEEAGFTGNYGLMDQVAALEWVHENIGEFGGDPDNVTIMGQSAGAMSVQQHLLSPLTKGLFNRAVMCSGGGVSEFMAPGKAEDSYDFGLSMMKKAGVTTLEEFRRLPVDRLFEAFGETCRENPQAVLGLGPVIDGRYITASPMELVRNGKTRNVEVMLGTTSEDMMSPLLFAMAFGYAKTIAAMNEKRTYMWFFDRQLPGDNVGAWHSSDLWYWFGTLNRSWRPMEEKDYRLSREMVDYLVKFAETGNPSPEGLPEWTPVRPDSDELMRLGEEPCHMGKVDQAKLKIRPKMPGMPD